MSHLASISHIRFPLTIHTTLFSATQPRSPHIYLPQSICIHPHSRVPIGVDLLTYTPPHSQYIQPLSRVPTGVDLPTHTLPFLCSLPTNTVRGRGIRGVVCYLSALLSLAGGQCQTRFVRTVTTPVGTVRTKRRCLLYDRGLGSEALLETRARASCS